MNILINMIGLILIAFIIIWFWLYKPKITKTTNDKPIEIKVANGVYEPNAIEIPEGKAITLHFLRTDPSSCSEYVIFDKLNISQQLPINQTKSIKLPALEPGEYEFTCQMGMYRGKLIVR